MVELMVVEAEGVLGGRGSGYRLPQEFWASNFCRHFSEVAYISFARPSHDVVQTNATDGKGGCPVENGSVNVVMEFKGGKKKSSSSSLQYEAPLGYSIEDVRPNGGIEKFRSAAYSNCVRKPS
ncbi:hypothetical protein HHK36_025974 [Tetracentron sinense]|uniref:Uncharacterized protein n=1 Tax=Tetracentron sinense TaxID=13715 RepID=A0A835D422_TETSI|nr:hypothetical protein HHK36_025974 [Tetracentron sinense]